METTKQTLELYEHEVDRVREIARDMGYTIGRGPMADTGSIRQLVEAIARGDVLVAKRNGEPEPA